MKTTLTPEQSATLIAKGISADKASAQGERIYKPVALQSGAIKRVFEGYEPIFTLSDVCALLPKGVIHNGISCKLRITSWYDEPYFAGYENQIGKYIMGNPCDAPFSAEELIDALYELLLWAIDNGYIDLTK